MEKKTDSYDAMHEAIQQFIGDVVRRSHIHGGQPMIHALAAVNNAVESAVSGLLQMNELSNPKGYSGVWTVGVAFDWLETIRSWEDKHWKPEIERQMRESERRERLAQ